MKQQRGFTLIEVIVLIVVSGLLANTIFLALTTAVQKTPQFLNHTIAGQTARQCIEWYLGQRRLQWGGGYESVACPSSTVPAFCTAPSGFTLAVNVACTTINSDASYKTITVTVSGKGNASYTTMIADY